MKKRALVPVIAGVVLLAVVGWFALSRGADDDAATTASGTVEATEADLGFQASGRIEVIAVREGETVTAGQELAALDAAELRARRSGAEAQVGAARALLAELERGARPEEVGQARAADAAARERVAEAERLYARTRALEEGGAVSRESLDQARSALEVARAQHAQVRAQLQLVQHGTRAERVTAQRAAVRQAEAALAQADAALAHATIRAPFGGIVTVRHRQPGETVAAGAPVLTIMNPADRWVRIYVREDEIGRVAVGQRVEIRTDSEPDRAYHGQVTYIASSAEFTPRSVQTTEERVKLVYAVKVSVTDDPRLVLKPGMPADVRLETRRQ